MSISVAVLVCGALSSYSAFLLWYGGRGSPMDSAEVESILERVRRNAEAAGAGPDPGLMGSIREVAGGDDGREFVMVNLIRYREKAAYPPGRGLGDDPHAADARYNRAVVPLLLKRACVPVFLGRSAGRFLAPEGAEPWDCVALVRYRSRRDFLEFCAEVAKDRADVHKWAAIEATQVFPVRARLGLFTVRLTLALAIALLAALGSILLASSGA
ncbi:hypothetical protein OJF2_70070 [Aquisphaera giovannonii]|uniref:DUF1330 domain-containing protein n=1 Tax=Aquisphaera giovannonii TaxID=406548 RepID=A0A5B9WCS2_9BACT|nr:hypothetical protein [Aquisphaera giovannonii]QEH38406.1 hypothetical protein OJF2_70070 [Aquisphaera giovannonii]